MLIKNLSSRSVSNIAIQDGLLSLLDILTLLINLKDTLHASDMGNWTIENSRPRLNIYLQKKKLPLKFDYTSKGPDHLR